MKANSPSLTAQGAALHRAAHQIFDRPPVFEDPLALRIIGPKSRAALQAGENTEELQRRKSLRAFIAARSRLSEDRLAQAVNRGISQYILLGAGLDTFAYRASQNFPGLRIFEVDHPATQMWKREWLTSCGIDVPATLTYAPIDFESETLVDGLARAGVDTTKPVMFAWLGVVPYLSHSAIMATLAFIAQLPEYSEVVFDYAEVPSDYGSDTPGAQAMQEMAARVAAAGEPFRSFFVPETLADEVRGVGFSRVEDFDAAKLNALYFSGRTDGLKLLGRGHLMVAGV